MSRARNLLADGLDWVAVKIWGLAHSLRPVVAATNEPRAGEDRTFGLQVSVLARAPSMKEADDLFGDLVVDELPDDKRVWICGWTTIEEPEGDENQ